MNRRIENVVASLGDILTRDYFSRFDPLVKWVRNPLAVLSMAILASVLCGLYLHPRAFLLATGLAVVLVIGTTWPWVALRGLSGTLSFGKPRVQEGEPVTMRLALRNRMPWGAWGLAIQGTVLDGSGIETTGLACAAGWCTTEVVRDLVPALRGEYPRVSTRVASAFPFGIWEASRPLTVASKLLVWPRTFPVGPIPEAADGRSGDGLPRRNKPGTSGDLTGVRPYRRGDAIRRIHWPQTARHGQLVVCELQANAVPCVQLVLDCHPDGHAGLGSDGSLEWSIRVAASFAEGWIGQGAEVEVVFGEQTVSALTGTVRARHTRVLDALARLEPDRRHSLQDVLGGPICRRFEMGLRIVIATDLALQSLTRRAGGAVAERFVVLNAAAFARDERLGELGPLSVRPWIWIDDAEQVPQRVRSRWKEVAIGS
jgi:uncharacterized protein (DUF58 family)